MANDIGIDLGTTSVIICVDGKNIVLNEPSVVAVDTRNKQVLAVGQEAYKMVGRTPAYIHAVSPLKDGVISDHFLTGELIKQFVGKVHNSKMMKPRIAVCVPAAITGIEKDAVVEAVMDAGARQVFLIDEPIAAAIGGGIDITKPRGHMAIDIGGGTTDIAVISLGGKVDATSINIAGNTLDEEIVKFIRHTYSLAVGEKTAELLKREVAACLAGEGFDSTLEIKGRCLLTGLPKRQVVTTPELLETVTVLAEGIAEAAHSVLERTPPELAGDIYEDGIFLTGGGARLKALPEYLSRKLKVKVHAAEDPINCVAIGTSKALSMMDILETGFDDATPGFGYKRRFK